MPKMQRRAILAGGLAAVAVTALPALAAGGAPATGRLPGPLPEWLPADFPLDGYAAIGRHVLASSEGRAALPAGRDALATTLRERIGRFEAANVREAVGRRIRADFAAGDVWEVDGWVLARTEVMLCCLVAESAQTA